jgi:multicomponent Na+:H+ antiporter subunit C
MTLIEMLIEHMNYIGAIAIFVIGLHTVVTHRNLIKRILGVNIMGTAVFLFFISIGNVQAGQPPIIIDMGPNVIYINPLPSVLILTGIVVVVSMTVYSLSLVIRIHQTYGTIDQEEIVKLQNEENSHD